MSTNYDAIPEELRWTKQWCIAGLDDATGRYRVPTALSNGRTYNASPTKSSTWTDFETVREFAETHPPHGVGFVLSASDCYVCIDLDVKNAANESDPKKWTPQTTIDRHHKIIQAFGSYTERSASGQGYHIWLKGHVGAGVRRDNVEIYSQERFIVCTGDVLLDEPIKENQELLNLLVAEMRKGEAPQLTLVDVEQTEGDEVIVSRAGSAENGSKFHALVQGDWLSLGYPSQSEADIALLTILAFYTKSNTQVLRIFRTTELGKRDKATRNDYYLLTSLKKVRSIAANEAIDSQVGEKIALALVGKLASGGSGATPNPGPAQPPSGPHTGPQQGKGAQPHPQTHTRHGNILQVNFGKPLSVRKHQELPKVRNENSIEYPPGVLGDIAKHIYKTSPRPIREVSIVAALGLAAGILGKAYCIPQSGLNLYVILVGQSAIGKEAMHSGISGIMKKIAGIIPESPDFVDFSEYVSGPALTKAVATKQSFVNVSGEFGRKLQRMAFEDRSDSTMQQLRTVMTHLYQKSGPSSMFGGLGYSDKDKNVASVSGVAYSMIGETTPGTFYDSLTEAMMADGFLSRFTIVEYIGDRPPLNENLNQPMDEELVERLVDLFRSAIAINGSGQDPRPVESEPDAAEFLSVFNIHCDKEINSTDNEGWRQMWNRAHLKVYRISALLAVCDNYIYPTIQMEHVMWAYDLVMRDINIMTRRMQSGDVGMSDATRENKLLMLCRKYLTTELAESYGIPVEMQKAGIIPRKYLQASTQRITSFLNHKLGQVSAMDMAIRSLCDGGYLAEVPKPEMIQRYSFHGKSYRILHMPMSDFEKKAARDL